MKGYGRMAIVFGLWVLATALIGFSHTVVLWSNLIAGGVLLLVLFAGLHGYPDGPVAPFLSPIRNPPLQRLQTSRSCLDVCTSFRPVRRRNVNHVPGHRAGRRNLRSTKLHRECPECPGEVHRRGQQCGIALVCRLSVSLRDPHPYSLKYAHLARAVQSVGSSFLKRTILKAF